MAMIGAAVISITIIALIIMTWTRRATSSTILALGFIGIAGGFAIPNLASIQRLSMAPGNMTAILQHVDTKASEVEDTQRRVTSLAMEVGEVNARVSASERRVSTLVKQANQSTQQSAEIRDRTLAALQETRVLKSNVAHMQRNMQQTWRSLYESYALSIGTRNLFVPMPKVESAIDKHLNTLASFAWPNRDERIRETTRVWKTVRETQKENETSN